MRPTDFDIHKIIDNLVGCCNSDVEDQLDFFYPQMTEDDLTSEDLTTFDQEIFNCTQCGWWCSTDECYDSEGGEQICEDCHNDEEGEDDEN